MNSYSFITYTVVLLQKNIWKHYKNKRINIYFISLMGCQLCNIHMGLILL